MIRRFFSCCGLLAISLSLTLPAAAANSFIEFSKLARSDSLQDMHGLGFYTIFSQASNHQYYAGIDFALFEIDDATESEIATRVLIGLAGTGRLSPYAEIGTSLFDILTGGSGSNSNCNQERSCRLDFHFRAGLRANVTKHLSIGVFYEGVRFGEFQDRLTGSHGYTGVTFGVRY